MFIETIICAAIHIENNKKYIHQPNNLSSGIVIGGWRHFNCLDTWFNLKNIKERKKYKITQGFLTSSGRFLDRIEARKIAFIAKQTNKETGDLFSEDLY